MKGIVCGHEFFEFRGGTFPMFRRFRDCAVQFIEFFLQSREIHAAGRSGKRRDDLLFFLFGSLNEFFQTRHFIFQAAFVFGHLLAFLRPLPASLF